LGWTAEAAVATRAFLRAYCSGEVHSWHAKSAAIHLVEELCVECFCGWADGNVRGPEVGHHDGRSAGQWNAAAGSDAGGDYEKCGGDFEEAACASGVWIPECEEAGREGGRRGGAAMVGGGGAGRESYLRAHGFGAESCGGVRAGDRRERAGAGVAGGER